MILWLLAAIGLASLFRFVWLCGLLVPSWAWIVLALCLFVIALILSVVIARRLL